MNNKDALEWLAEADCSQSACNLMKRVEDTWDTNDVTNETYEKILEAMSKLPDDPTYWEDCMAYDEANDR